MSDAPIRLRETPNAAVSGARVIDASFQVVRDNKRSILRRMWIVCIAVFWAALIGFALPPLWVIAQRLLER
ncbi:MAG: hypothetical protein WAU68_01550 [Vitreimonas sp.]